MNLKYWVWLQLALGFGSKYSDVLLERLGSAENIYKADKNLLKNLEIGKKTADKLSNKSLKTALEIVAQCKKGGIEIIPYSSCLYPERLRKISSPPIVLYAKGDTSLLSEEVSISIVGPRKVSVYRKAAFCRQAEHCLRHSVHRF